MQAGIASVLLALDQFISAHTWSSVFLALFLKKDLFMLFDRVREREERKRE